MNTPFIRWASPLGLPHTRSRSPLRRLAPIAWLASDARSHVASTNLTAGRITVREIGSSLFGLLAAAVLCGACAKPLPVLHVYTWADYVKPELVQRFEAEQRCRVVIDTFDSNEAMFAKMKAGATGYDLVTPSSYMVSVLHSQGLLQPLDASLIPNRKNVDPEYLKIALDPTMDHSVPYLLTNSGVAYLASKVKDPVPSWKMFDRADLKGRMTMLNDMRETIGAALKSLGYSLNTTDEKQLEEARAVVVRWKKNLAKFENEQYQSGLASGEFLLVHGYSGDILKAQQENADVTFVIPQEGTSMAADDLVIPKAAIEVRLAHAFINFLHDPDVAAENTNFISYLCPNVPAYQKLSPKIRDNPAIIMDPAIRAKSEVIRDLGVDNAKYVKVWDEIKAAK
jgi:spermidine/putrescine transport system substrate-binding protein